MPQRRPSARARVAGFRCLLIGAAALALQASITSPLLAQTPAPVATGAEAENFKVESGWKVLKYGEGNYMVDTVGFCHVSGEKLLSLPAGAAAGSASQALNVAAPGNYRLWVRYEYPAWSDTSFKAIVEQGGKVVAEKVMGTRQSPRLLYGQYPAKPQHDPSWGPEGIAEESVDAPNLAAGPVTIKLVAAEQPAIEGVKANRNIDLVYLTNDLTDTWAKAPGVNYPLLNAFGAAIGPRWEVRVSNNGTVPAIPAIRYTYNRVPWYGNEPGLKEQVAPGAASNWIPLTIQDTAHFSGVAFTCGNSKELTVEVRAVGSTKAATFTDKSGTVSVLIPTYPSEGEPCTVETQIDKVLAKLASAKAPGKEPTAPLAYGGWVPVNETTSRGKKYAELFKAMGMRNMPSTEKAMETFTRLGIAPTKSVAIMGYRNPPTPEGIAAAVKLFPKENPARPYLRWFDYGDEIAFSEWMALAAGKSGAAAVPGLFRDWLAKHRPGFKAEDYWLDAWGAMDPAKLKPDSSSKAAAEKPRLYVDSLLFYEDTAIAFVAAGKQAVKAEFGPDVLCGANYSCHPFYQPTTTMYIKWFRGGAADFGRHSEYFWQIAQPGPSINGFVAEHFRAGMRFLPEGINRAYTMPHSPGNTDASFRRTAYTHLAHGAKNLDYFGIGMNDTFTENFIDHRDADRFVAIRDVNHSMALVEDVLPASNVVASDVALLVSESTERWDFAGMALDQAGHDLFGANFRKNRLNHHLDRFGLWQSLSFAGSSPDLVIEDDLNAKILGGYKVLFVVGDSVPASVVPALDEWVKQGGVLVATEGVGRFGTYKEPNPAMEKLLGIASRKFEERDTFMRITMELPFLKPHSTLVLASGAEMPVVGNFERVTPAPDAKVVATFKEDKAPAAIVREIGKGKIYYVSAHIGVSYLWTGLHPILVPDRGANTHTVRANWDKAAIELIASMLKAGHVEPAITTTPGLIDARLIKGKGSYILPMSNYNSAVGQDVSVGVRVPEGVASVVSAYAGNLEFKSESGQIRFTVPKLGYGDVVRINLK